MSALGWIESVFKDIRFAVRTLLKNPAFTLAAGLSLGLGIGANTAIFTLLNSLLLNPLPLLDQSRLVAVFTQERAGNLLPLSYANYADYRDKNEVFTDMCAFSAPMGVTVLKGSAQESLHAEIVTGNYFDLLGIRPAAGRFFLPEEDRTPGAHLVVVLSHATWQARFGGDPSIMGHEIKLNNLEFTVIGIAPKGFKGVNALFGPDLWLTAMMADRAFPGQKWRDDRGLLAFRVAARLRPGVELSQAEAQLRVIANGLELYYPEPNRGRSVALRGIAEATLFDNMRRPILFGGVILMAIVGLVLLIACSNVANLLLARASGRRQEIAVRQALGAGRGRLIRQLLTESMLLGLAGGAVGIAFGSIGRDLLWSLRPAVVAQNFVEPKLNLTALLFAFLLSIMAGVIFGLAPALQMARPGIVEWLKEETSAAGRSRRRLEFGNALVIGQVALSLVLLTIAGLFLRSLQQAYTIDLGFETRRLAIIMINPGQLGYSQARAEQLYSDVRARVASLSGVALVSLAENAPLWARSSRSIVIEGAEQRDSNNVTLTVVTTIDLDYFKTLAIPLIRGRDFTAADRGTAVPVAIVNETLARKYWPDQEAIGKRFRLSNEKTFREIIGIAKAAKYTTLGEAPQTCVYLPLRQSYEDSLSVYVRTARDPSTVLSALQREIRALDAGLPVESVTTMAQVIDDSLWMARLAVGLLGVFGSLALALASVGLYGVMAYSVGRRPREIGIRIALGANRSSILKLVLRRGLTLVEIGLGIGLILALMAGRALASQLVGVGGADPLSLAAASGTLLIVAFAACYLPALRASRLDPLVALREG